MSKVRAIAALVLGACFVLASAGGCVIAAANFLAASKDEAREHLIHLPGIAGEQNLDRRFIRGLRAGGCNGTIEIYDWTEKDPGLAALLARQRNDREATKIAEKIKQILKDEPGVKLRIIGHSGGAGLAVWALERLPGDSKIESVVFLAPALSQKYDLSKALSHVRGKAYALTSVNDAIILGAGTKLFGTIDGKKEEAAGLRGFKTPDKPFDPKQYDKLVQMPYQDSWMELGNIGDHIGPMGEEFAEKVIAPLLRDRPPLPTTRPAKVAGAKNASSTPPAAASHTDTQ
jgi:pimeloyl-ACP methyl ester carboxylesterase